MDVGQQWGGEFKSTSPTTMLLRAMRWKRKARRKREMREPGSAGAPLTDALMVETRAKC